MSRNNFIIIFVLVLIVLAIGVCFWSQWKTQNSFSVVYLTTGEVYIGHLSYMPELSLKGAYQFQTVKDPNDPTKSTYQIAPVSQALWAPQTLYINPRQVVFSGPLSDSSKIVQSIKNGTAPK